MARLLSWWRRALFGPHGLLKKTHLRRWLASALAAAYLQYASLGHRPAALHLGLFEQPE
jgi:hypothetical protein